MSAVKRRGRAERKPGGIALAILLAVLTTAVASCAKKEEVRRYHLKGRVVSIDLQQSQAVIDHERIPGFMEAMTMPYPVRDRQLLQSLGPGDEITGDVVVTEEGAYLENVVVSKKGQGAPAQPAPPAGGPGTHLHQPQPGEKVPDFAMINQDGQRIHLASFRGHVLLVTFIYTRCPYPNFCPLVSKNFASIYAQTRQARPSDSRIRLLSVSFDPEHDTPDVLRRYGETFRQTTGGLPFDRWQFAAVPEKDLPKVAEFFGLTYRAEGNEIDHSLSTTVIGPNGTVYKWYFGNGWSPADLMQDAAQALEQNSRDHRASVTLARSPHA